MCILLGFLVLVSASSPEEFLDELCLNSQGLSGAEFWAEHASVNAQNNLTGSDTLLVLLNDKIDLQAAPGARTSFETQGNLFIIRYGRSSWTWSDGNGRLHKTEGTTIVQCEDGEYSWTSIPVLVSGSVSVGETEKLVSGFMMTLLLLMFAVILVAWAKRRYL